MNKDLYIEMLEKRVAELEENNKDYDYAINQMEEAQQKLADLENRNELILKIIKRDSDGCYRLAKSCKEDNEQVYNRCIASMSAYEDVIRYFESDEYLIEISNIYGIS